MNGLAAAGFLAPSFLGFLTFVAFPVVFSIIMSLTDWTFRRGGTIQFVGLRNFTDILADPDFWRYFGNTAFLMLAIPLTIAGALLLAVLLCQQLKGIVFFRTLFYLPHFTSGVALLVLWKHLYNPEFGPINTALRPALNWAGHIGRTWPPFIFYALGGLLLAVAAGLFLGALALLVRWAANSMRDHLREFGRRWWRVAESGAVSLVIVLLGAAFFGALAFVVYLGGDWVLHLPRTAAAAAQPGALELKPPQWLSSIAWAKPAIMLMGLWTGIGGANMLLYIAGISNIPADLYEAAAIDGAGRWARFLHVTWPQLRPTTFFIVVMSLIGGLQGGFEQARVLTEGGPAGATTTLSYYIFSKGIETRQMGYACAVAWIMFIFIFIITALNWRYGRGGDSDVT